MKKIDNYKIIKTLGRGGNGKVYLCEKEGKEFAVKTLNRLNNLTLSRFKNEISLLKAEKDNKGILPILDDNLNEENGELFYVMPVAKDLSDIEDVKQIIDYTLQLIDTLHKLHKKNIFHRDIKPSNIYIYNERCVLSDFGLVKFPKSNKITQSNKKLGPFATIAPEMRRNPNISDCEKADIYSLAKTLWILLSKKSLGFDGIYDRKDSKITLDNLKNLEFKVILHETLERGTNSEPSERLSLLEFEINLKSYLKGLDDFYYKCNLEWNDISKTLFSKYTPDEATWVHTTEICDILNIISKYENINHCFLPAGGGLDISFAVTNRNYVDFIELNLSGIPYLIKPKYLKYASINKNPHYTFFWVELEKLEPISIKYKRSKSEDLYELFNKDSISLISECELNDEEYYELKKENKIRIVIRIIEGNLLITSKSSLWNNI